MNLVAYGIWLPHRTFKLGRILCLVTRRRELRTPLAPKRGASYSEKHTMLGGGNGKGGPRWLAVMETGRVSDSRAEVRERTPALPVLVFSHRTPVSRFWGTCSLERILCGQLNLAEG